MLLRYLSLSMLLVFAGCATSVDQEDMSDRNTAASKRNIKSSLSNFNDSPKLFAAKTQLSEVERALKQNDLARAKVVLELMVPPPQSLVIEYLFLSAQTAIADRQSNAALSFLSDERLVNSKMDSVQAIEFAKLKSNAYLLNRSFIASAKELMNIDSLLQRNERVENHDKIYELLMALPSRSLAVQADKEINGTSRGWLSLAALTKQNENDPLLQLQALNKWKLAWAHHTASKILPRSLEMLSKIVSERPTKVALFLPFQGPLSAAGKAIRDGFIAGQYAHQDEKTIILNYDTSTESITDLLERAKNEGIQLIIGPLDRDIVTELASMELKIPVLALNRTSDKSFNPNLYQFGLSPEDEINQVVEQTLDEGLKESVVIYPDSDWGKRNFAVFENSWGLRGGNIVDSASFSSQRDYSGLIKSLLNIDKSEEREKELRRITGHSFEFTPRRRKDIDFILLLANSSQARGINPTLEHFYAEDIPVYSISHIHEINASWIDTIDLDGIKFCEIPWKLSAFDNVQREIQANWSGAQGGLAAFYALGLDAYRLYPRLRQLKELPHQKLFGTTGRLTIDKSNIIRRELIWATFRDGRPTRIFF